MTARRSSGESTTYRAHDGRWHGFVSMGVKREGRRDRRHVSGQTRSDVVAKVRELERNRDAGTSGASGRTSTVAAWLDHWLNTIAARKVLRCPRSWRPWLRRQAPMAGCTSSDSCRPGP